MNQILLCMLIMQKDIKVLCLMLSNNLREQKRLHEHLCGFHSCLQLFDLPWNFNTNHKIHFSHAVTDVFRHSKAGIKNETEKTFYTDLCSKPSNVEIRPLQAAAIFNIEESSAQTAREKWHSLAAVIKYKLWKKGLVGWERCVHPATKVE